MCGLAGVLSPDYLTNKEKKAFVELGMLSFFRGVDSTGIATVTKKKPKSPHINVNVMKSVDHPIDFFRNERTLSEVYKGKVLSIMAHSRAATVGDINLTNAQPVVTDGLVGCHNGTVRWYSPLKRDEDKETDSSNLYDAITNDGIDKAIDRLGAGDAFALTYIDKRTNKMYWVRNHLRPLWMCTTKQGVIYWASEKPMLTFALEREGLEIESYTEPKADELIEYNFMTNEIDSRPLVKTLRPTYTPGTTFNVPWVDSNVVRLTQPDKRYSFIEEFMNSTVGKRLSFNLGF